MNLPSYIDGIFHTGMLFNDIYIYFKAEARSNETGIEHIAKNYHSLNPSDVELLEECIKNPSEHFKDKNRTRTYYYYYHNRKHDKSHYIKVVVKVAKHDPKIGYISTIFITSKIRNK